MVGVAPGVEEDVAAREQIDIDVLTQDQKKVFKARAQEEYLATIFVLQADKRRFGVYIEKLENDYLQGQDRYPRTLDDAYNLLANRKQVQTVNAQVPSTRVSFTNVGDDIIGNQDPSADITGGLSEMTLTTDGQSRSSSAKDVTCFRCGQKGHYAPECDNDRKKTVDRQERQTGTQMFMDALENDEFSNDDQVAFSFHTNGTGTLQVLKTTDLVNKIQREGRVPDFWILLDNQSTVDVFCNRKRLKNIRKSDTTMDIHCNAGVTSTDLIGDYPGYGTVWYYPKGIANILSLSRVKNNGFCVTYDSVNGNEFIVSKLDTKRIFHRVITWSILH
jgi:hypothetical protein